jgi:sporulation protein YlmC with PRC-barrel domain
MPRIAASALAVITILSTASVLGQEPGPRTTVGAVSPNPAADWGWRCSRIVGATVYDDTGESIGKIDDLIVGKDGKISTAVISIGGFLGIGKKLVGVRIDQLRFEERVTVGTELAPSPVSTGAPTTAPGPTARDVPVSTPLPRTEVSRNETILRIVLPGASKDSLTSMPEFDYGA